MKTQLNGFSKEVLDNIVKPREVISLLYPYKESVIALFDGGYSRVGVILKAVAECDVCHKETNVILIDASEDEYASGNICFDCIKLAMQES